MTFPATPARASFSDRLEPIRQRFLDDLPQRRDGLLAAIAGQGGEAADLRSAERIAHRISGVAGSLGLAELGRLASDVEVEIAAAIARPEDSAATDAAGTVIGRLAEAIGQVIDTRQDWAPDRR
ncbi:Hpt domain-containing protein [Wenxinia saemankumensis]|uniref:Hpt domain-containing protein n=1 Tax=Wenxinia saemankumensis TaxID=1447782 RepID=A0A1M6ADN1_9RHOB|nr:Hpt domain-containing protein [Wenxinia saemankumensis]SHI34559.1 Hpt domain-containing protein [Wenxinia saemankumensis]